MACETEVWQAKLTLGAGSFCRCIMPDDSLLVRVVTSVCPDVLLHARDLSLQHLFDRYLHGIAERRKIVSAFEYEYDRTGGA